MTIMWAEVCQSLSRLGSDSLVGRSFSSMTVSV